MGTLGFTDNARRTLARDPHFAGASRHPSRPNDAAKRGMGAVPRGTTTLAAEHGAPPPHVVPVREPATPSMPPPSALKPAMPLAPPAGVPKAAMAPKPAGAPFMAPKAGGAPAPAARPPTDALIHERRFAHLEGALKEIIGSVAELRGELGTLKDGGGEPALGAAVKALANDVDEYRKQITTAAARATPEAPPAGLFVRATALRPTPSRTDRDGPADEGKAIPEGSELRLTYPMVRAKEGGVWMRYLNVDPYTAGLHWQWAKLWEEHPKKGDIVYVSDFR